MTISTNTYTVGTLAEAFFQWKEDMVAAGAYSVASSSDGTTYKSSGDQISHGGSGAEGMANDGAWMRLSATGGTIEMVLQIPSGADPDSGSIWYSCGTHPFTGGSPGVTTRPTATGEQSGNAAQAGALAGGPYDITIGVDDAAPYNTYLTFTTGGAPYAGYMLNAVAATGDPAVMFLFDPAGTIYAQGFELDTPYAWDTLAAQLANIGAGGGGGGDTTAPTIDGFNPATNSSITRVASVAVDVADETALGTVWIWGELADGTRLLVYDGAAAAFVGSFAASSTHVGDTFTVVPDSPGWASSSVTLSVYAVDAAGNDASASASYTISDAPAAPVIGSFSPSDGGNTTRTGTVTIDVTDDEGRTAIANVQIAATLASGQVLTVYNGSTFPGVFAAASARSNVTSGYRYSIVHDGAGWPSATIAFRVTATDTQGRTTTDTSYNIVVTDAPAAPTIGSWSPSAGAVSRTDDVAFSVACPDGFASITISAVLGDGSTVTVYDGASFGAQVDAGSSVSGTTTKSFTVMYDGDGWLDDYTLKVRATSSLGLTSTATQAYTLTDAPAPSTPDTTNPTVALVSPAANSEIARTDALVFDVTDEGGLSTVFVWVTYPSGPPDLVHDGDAFTLLFAGASSRASITNGYRYTLRRAGGWPFAPTVRVRPVDASGNTP